MLKLSRLTDYAAVVMAQIARHPEQPHAAAVAATGAVLCAYARVLLSATTERPQLDVHGRLSLERSRNAMN